MDNDFIGKYFGVFTKPRTYTNILYLLLSFPLGIAYFILLVTGFSLGISLIIVWVGLLILAILLPVIWMLIAFERGQAIFMLGEDIPPMDRPTREGTGFLARIKEFITNPVTWKGTLFLVLKFPIGIAAFVLITVGLSVGLAFIFAPLIYPFGTIDLGFSTIDSMSEAFGLSIVGVLIFPGILHMFNYAAMLCGKIAKAMLGQTSFAAATPPAAGTGDQAQVSPQTEAVVSTDDLNS